MIHAHPYSQPMPIHTCAHYCTVFHPLTYALLPSNRRRVYRSLANTINRSNASMFRTRFDGNHDMHWRMFDTRRFNLD
jgi:hypothetical protein